MPTRSVTSRPSSEPSGSSLAPSPRPTPTDQTRRPSWPTPSPRLRKAGNPYQLAHGLIDYAEMLLRTGNRARRPR